MSLQRVLCRVGYHRRWRASRERRAYVCRDCGLVQPKDWL